MSPAFLIFVYLFLTACICPFTQLTVALYSAFNTGAMGDLEWNKPSDNANVVIVRQVTAAVIFGRQRIIGFAGRTAFEDKISKI